MSILSLQNASFAWIAPKEGFEIVTAEPQPPRGTKGAKRVTKALRWIVPKLLLDGFWFGRMYDPFGSPALFREFAALAPASEEGVLGFANRYGPLMGVRAQWTKADSTMILKASRRDETAQSSLQKQLLERGSIRLFQPEGELAVIGEAVSFWQAEVAAMAQAVALWRAIAESDQDAMGALVTWNPGEGLRYVNARPNARPSAFLMPTAIFPLPVQKEFNSKGPHAACRFVLASLVNESLSRHSLRAGIQFSLLKGTVLELVPSSLLCALWLQLAQAVEGNREQRKCEAPKCKAWFELGQKRSHSRFCNDTCRQAGQAERRKTARELFAQKAPVAEIAERVRSTPQTVRRWIRK